MGIRFVEKVFKPVIQESACSCDLCERVLEENHENRTLPTLDNRTLTRPAWSGMDRGAKSVFVPKKRSLYIVQRKHRMGFVAVSRRDSQENKQSHDNQERNENTTCPKRMPCSGPGGIGERKLPNPPNETTQAHVSRNAG
jgi:hypothetical protein